jgi:hypothetical protein
MFRKVDKKNKAMEQRQIFGFLAVILIAASVFAIPWALWAGWYDRSFWHVTIDACALTIACRMIWPSELRYFAAAQSGIPVHSFIFIWFIFFALLLVVWSVAFVVRTFIFPGAGLLFLIVWMVLCFPCSCILFLMIEVLL